jgi:hypothetical protein
MSTSQGEGVVYIGNKPGDEFISHHASTIDAVQLIENAVLAGPVTFTNVITITGNVVIV